MKTAKSSVRGGVISVPKGAHLREGQKVLLIPVPDPTPAAPPPATVEDEDVAFVRACRGRLARQLEAEDVASGS